MVTLLVWATLLAPPVGRFYFTDPDRSTPILPAAALPRVAGGLLPPPPPPSDRFLRVNKARGEFVLTRVVVDERFDAARFYPLVGNARLWRLTYRIKIIGPGGELRSVYVDRNALVLVP